MGLCARVHTHTHNRHHKQGMPTRMDAAFSTRSPLVPSDVLVQCSTHLTTANNEDDADSVNQRLLCELEHAQSMVSEVPSFNTTVMTSLSEEVEDPELLDVKGRPVIWQIDASQTAQAPKHSHSPRPSAASRLFEKADPEEGT